MPALLRRVIVAFLLIAGLLSLTSTANATDGTLAPQEIVDWLEAQPGRWPSINEATNLSNCESGGNYAAQNPISTASGRWQFLTTTWNGEIRSMPASLHQYTGSAKQAPHWVQDVVFISHFKKNGGRPWVCRSGGQAGEIWVGEHIAFNADRPAVAKANLELLEAGPSQIRIHGWAFDPNDPTAEILVHLYAFYDGDFIAAALSTPVVTAGDHRPDVNAAYDIEGNHGFNRTVSVKPGNHRICAYSISVNKDGVEDGLNRLIACNHVTVTRNAKPHGTFDSAARDGETLTITGWAYDLDTEPEGITVHVYVDGQSEAAVVANKPRKDVNEIVGVPGDHGFDASFDIGPGTHEVCIYAIGVNGTGESDHDNVSMGCRFVGP